MATRQLIRRLSLKNILFLTDFSEPSDVALPYAASLARGYDASVIALHVLTPPPTSGLTVQQVAAAIEAREDAAAASMIRIDSQLGGISHETITLHDGTVWSAVWKTIEERHIDLIVTEPVAALARTASSANPSPKSSAAPMCPCLSSALKSAPPRKAQAALPDPLRHRFFAGVGGCRAFRGLSG